MRLFVALLVASASLAYAQVPRTVSFQAILTQPSGQAVTSPVAITFKLYTAPTGESALWSEAHSPVVPANGLVAVMLGSVTPLSLAFDQPYYLGITVDANPEMTPRTALVAAPYAFRSAYAEALANPVVGGSIVDHSIPLDRLGNACAAGQILVRSASGWECKNGP